MFTFQQLPLAPALQITYPHFTDARGGFTKVFQDDLFQNAGVHFELKECYFSVSAQYVIRGMHFQAPPHDHHKIIFCPQGTILDVLLDLRCGSPTYGQFYATELSGENHRGLFIPKGFAHGFQALTKQAMTCYLVSSVHAPSADLGVRWDSFGLQWPAPPSSISPRDDSFPPLTTFTSPFLAPTND